MLCGCSTRAADAEGGGSGGALALVADGAAAVAAAAGGGGAGFMGDNTGARRASMGAAIAREAVAKESAALAACASAAEPMVSSMVYAVPACPAGAPAAAAYCFGANPPPTASSPAYVSDAAGVVVARSRALAPKLAVVAFSGLPAGATGSTGGGTTTSGVPRGPDSSRSVRDQSGASVGAVADRSTAPRDAMAAVSRSARAICSCVTVPAH